MNASPEEHSNADWWRPLRSLFTLAPAPWRWRVGLQAALALGIPLAAFTLAGEQPLGLVASLGAMTALYASALAWTDRRKVLPIVGIGFIGGSLVGAMAAPSIGAVVGGLVMVSAIACILCFALNLGPPGPVMFILVTGVSATVATSETFSGSWHQRLQVPGLIAVGVLSAYLIVGAVQYLQSGRRQPDSAGSSHFGLQVVSLDSASWIITRRVVAAVAVSACVAYATGIHHAYWVVVAAAVVLQADVSASHTARRMGHRVLGTCAGLGVFGGVRLFHLDGLALVLLLACLQGLVVVVVARNYGLAMLFATPLALSVGTVNDPSVQGVVWDRVLDTVIGVGIAVIILMVSLGIRRG